jgi:hypothetical protein
LEGFSGFNENKTVNNRGHFMEPDIKNFQLVEKCKTIVEHSIDPSDRLILVK